MIDSLANFVTAQPLMAGGFVLVGMVSLWIGWKMKTVSARHQQAAMKQAVLEAKRCIPQFESSVRARDQQIDRLKMEMDDLKGRSAELHQALAQKEADMRSQTREIRTLTTEVRSAKRVQSDDSLVLDGMDFGDDSDSIEDAQIQARVDKAEALYEQLRTTLAEREDRILELEARLGEDATGDTVAVEPRASGTVALLEERLATHEATIERLETALDDVREERNTLSGMLATRGKGQQPGDSSSVELLDRVTHLERTLDLRNQVVQDRDAALKRLLAELEQASADKQAQKAQLERCLAEVRYVSQERDAQERKVGDLIKELDYLREQQASGHRELDDVRHQLEQSESWLDKFKSASTKRSEELAQITAERDALRARLGELEADYPA